MALWKQVQNSLCSKLSSEQQFLDSCPQPQCYQVWQLSCCPVTTECQLVVADPVTTEWCLITEV